MQKNRVTADLPPQTASPPAPPEVEHGEDFSMDGKHIRIHIVPQITQELTVMIAGAVKKQSKKRTTSLRKKVGL